MTHHIHSMTAFARTQQALQFGSVLCELRSVNHRYLDINVYLPEHLYALEMPVREGVRQLIKRGKIECRIRYESANAEEQAFSVNTVLAQRLCDAVDGVKSFVNNPAPVNVIEVLRWPGVLQVKEMDLSLLEKEVLSVLKKALQELIVVRAREGDALKQLFLQRLMLMEAEVAKVKQRLPEIWQEQRERLLKRFGEAKLELNAERLEQEMLLFIQRMDVTEELERLTTHITEMRRMLEEGGAIGKRADFLLQELNREANTLGSKSADALTTKAAIDLKVLIEQIREQVQNIE